VCKLSLYNAESLPQWGINPQAIALSIWVTRDILLDFGARSVADLYYQPLRHCHTSFDSPATRCSSIFSAAAASHFAWSPCLPMRQVAYCDSSPPCCCSVALLSTSAHVGTKIHIGCVVGPLGGATTHHIEVVILKESC
jgi:hypothetical protein